MEPQAAKDRDAKAVAVPRILVYPPGTGHNLSGEWMAVLKNAPEGTPEGFGRDRQAAIDDLKDKAKLEDVAQTTASPTSNIYSGMDWFMHDDVDLDNPVTGSTLQADPASQNNPGFTNIDEELPFLTRFRKGSN